MLRNRKHVFTAAAVAALCLGWTVDRPDTTDSFWQNVTLELLSGKSLKQLLPKLDHALRIDSNHPHWMQLWGNSINFDELAGGVIVDPSILGMLTRQMHAPIPSVKTDALGHTVVHAGMEHTYGYLFSNLKTQFGFKRARWIEGEIARGFELPTGSLSPLPNQGTLFSNLTHFAGHIAFRNDPAALAILQKSSASIPKALTQLDYKALSPLRLEETLTLSNEKGPRQITLRTDFVPFKTPQKNSHLLIYSIADSSRPHPVLITAFPVSASFVEAAIKPESLGENKLIQTRYNAFIENVTGTPLNGVRKVTP